MKKIIFLLMLLLSISIFAEKFYPNSKNDLSKMIGQWVYSKTGYQDPIAIRRLPSGVYQIGFLTWEENADKNGFEWNDLQLLNNGIIHVKGINMFIGYDKKNRIVFIDKNGNITEYYDKKIK